MKVRQQGSFGIPEQMQEQIEKVEERKRAEPKKPVEEAQIKKEEKELKDELDPRRRLAEVGAKFDDEDLQKLLFKGYYEAENLIVVRDPSGKRDLTVTMRTLNGRDYEDIDEILGQELKIDMTTDGFQSRRSIWILAYSVQTLNGKMLASPVLDEGGVLDRKATARAKRNVLLELSATVLNKLIRMQHQVHTAIELLLNDEEHTYLKKS